MIEFLEIRDTTRKLVGVIDSAKSIIWVTEYYGAGSFEVYAALTEQTKALLQEGYYITRRNEINAGIIENIQYTNSPQDGVMIIASGRMLKSILDRRIVYQLTAAKNSPTRISGNVATAVQGVVYNHAGAGAVTARQMGVLRGSNGGITKTIVTDSGQAGVRQTSYGGLLEFTDSVLQEYECGSLIRLNSNLNFVYDCFEGKDRSVGNTAGNTPITFSQNFENLVSAEYLKDMTTWKNSALVGGEGEGTSRFFVFVPTLPVATGMNRREVFIDASGFAKTYTDDSGQEQTYTDIEYARALVAQGRSELRDQTPTETFTGEIDLAYSPYKFGQSADFWLGDLVTIQDNRLGLSMAVRVLKATEVQDDGGYSLTIEYGN